MTTISRTFQTFINAKPETVFAYVADLTKHSEWNSGLVIEAVTPGPIQVGSQYRSRGVVLNQKDRPNELRVTQYEPITRFGFASQDPDFKEVTHDFTFSPQSSGTLLSRTFTVNLPPLVAFGFSTFIFPFVGKPSMEKSHAMLKSKLEQTATQ